MADTGPPIVLFVVGLVLWLAVDATVGGISIQTVGVILAAAGAVWLIIEMIQARALRRHDPVVVRDEPVPRRRRL